MTGQTPARMSARHRRVPSLRSVNDAPTGPPGPPADYAPSVLPSTGARALAFGAILVAGLCGGLIGYAVVDLQCEGDCTAWSGLSGLVGAIVFAVGVGIVAVLALRAMGEWRVIQHEREQAEDRSDDRR